jgi:phosphoribosylanthranilate isomerase
VTRVKVCGLRRIDDALLAVELGAHALGFIFWPSSPRFIEPEAAQAIVGDLPPFVATVGVFVDQPVEYVADVARGLKLGVVQLHGHEDPAAFMHLPQQVVKAVPVEAGADVAHVVAALPDGVTVLLDAHDPVMRGGTGRTIDWTTAAVLARRRRVILAGGLNANNVRSAVETVRPIAVDVSSGVESAPGKKDPDKMRALFRALGDASASPVKL